MENMNKLDDQRIVECSLAIIGLTLHEDDRVWKGFDWDVLDEMYRKGWISDPVNKNKSVYLTKEGLKNVQKFQKKYFAQSPQSSKTSSKPKSKTKAQDLSSIDLSKAHVVRCTEKLLKELRIKPVEFETTGEASTRDWHANLLVIDRRKCILVTHTLSLYSFFIFGVTRKDLDNFKAVFNEHLRIQLSSEGIPKSALYDVDKPDVDLVITKTNSKSVLGSMNEYSYRLEFAVWDWEGTDDPNEVKMADYINDTPMSAIEETWPPRQLRKVLKNAETNGG
jgi:hypothetical protein